MAEISALSGSGVMYQISGSKFTSLDTRLESEVTAHVPPVHQVEDVHRVTDKLQENLLEVFLRPERVGGPQLAVAGAPVLHVAVDQGEGGGEVGPLHHSTEDTHDPLLGYEEVGHLVREAGHHAYKLVRRTVESSGSLHWT